MCSWPHLLLSGLLVTVAERTTTVEPSILPNLSFSVLHRLHRKLRKVVDGNLFPIFDVCHCLCNFNLLISLDRSRNLIKSWKTWGFFIYLDSVSSRFRIGPAWMVEPRSSDTATVHATIDSVNVNNFHDFGHFSRIHLLTVFCAPFWFEVPPADVFRFSFRVQLHVRLFIFIWQLIKWPKRGGLTYCIQTLVPYYNLRPPMNVLTNSFFFKLFKFFRKILDIPGGYWIKEFFLWQYGFQIVGNYIFVFF